LYDVVFCYKYDLKLIEKKSHKLRWNKANYSVGFIASIWLSVY